MFDFANPYLLYLLWLVPVFAVVYWLARRSRAKRLRKFGRPEVIASLMPDASRYKPAIKITLRLIALAALVIVLARPRAGEKEHDETVAGIEVMIAFDISNSMLASSTDDPNGTSRLDRARLLLEKLLGRLHNNKVGLVIFAGSAKVQFPMTTDFYTAKMYLSELNPSMMAYQGTSVAEAISMAMNGFSPDENVHKAIILITDSEDHEGDAVEAAKAAAKAGIQVDVVGLGSAKGAPIPMPGRNGEYFTDNEGKMVLTTLNEQLATEIADAGDGIFVNGASSDALDKLADRLETLQKSEFKHVTYSAGAEQFPLFAWIALVFLVIDLFVLDRKNNILRKINFFSKK
ncbi:MAG: VWA domain-containing protein [Muribaculaceae bacterium]|nr:VWA domain-containing protein [Muribaculaceae bacterium]MCI9055566.1 VWA domain-containing protein [Muribaculaceae bacterium]